MWGWFVCLFEGVGFLWVGFGVFFDEQNTSLNAVSSSNSSGEISGLHMHFYNVLGKK